MQPGAGCRVGCVLEGWNIDDNTDVPGDTLFYDMVYKSYGAAHEHRPGAMVLDRGSL